MISTYLAPLDQVDQVRDAHIAFVEELGRAGVLVAAGRQDPPVGGVIILDVDSEAEARELMAPDPYLLQGLAEYSATGWTPARGVLVDWKS
ncbi:YciI family protein [Actinoplanes sp. NPDC049668]|uniref:YciI family protein n=1 Tax=unclassified Actinoplanes TaxID=2626549 RepID=UPI0033A37EAB